jgi:hypothetical protein
MCSASVVAASDALDRSRKPEYDSCIAHQTHFPAGSLRAEAAALRVETEGRLGNYVQAVRLGSAFLASYPNSPLAARVSALTERYRATLSKP